MEPLKQIKINEFIEIEIVNDSSQGTFYKTKVMDILENKNIISIGWPTLKGKYLAVRKNDKINALVKTEDGVFSFESKVISRTLDPYAHIKLILPESLIKKQRRAFFRLPINLMIDFIKVKEMDALQEEYNEKKAKGEEVDMYKFLPPVYKAVTVDISGGGLSILSKITLEQDEELEVTFELTNKKKYKDLSVKVKRIIELGNKFNYGLEFSNIKNMDREQIVSWSFETQRMRTK